MPILAAGLFLVLGISLVFSRPRRVSINHGLETVTGDSGQVLTLEEVAQNGAKSSRSKEFPQAELIKMFRDGLQKLTPDQRKWVVSRAIQLGGDSVVLKAAL